jgi:prepilin-type N-terminal cleavage/methylation domain-containing protein
MTGRKGQFGISVPHSAKPWVAGSGIQAAWRRALLRGRPRRFPRASRGFSLVEMAVVLVVVGLVLAAVLQGRHLITSAEYKAFKGQLSEYRNAFYTFRDRYDALPGDFDDAENRLANMGSNDNGDGDGVVEPGPVCNGATDESCLAWQHLRAAGMIAGNPSLDAADASPDHTYGGSVASFFTGDEGNSTFGHKISVDGVPADVARRLDEDVDDELCDSGRVSAMHTGDCTGSSSDDWPAGHARIDIVYAL